jgi:hypothetical protein
LFCLVFLFNHFPGLPYSETEKYLFRKGRYCGAQNKASDDILQKIVLDQLKVQILAQNIAVTCTNGAPKNKEAAIMKGINGGKLTLEATKASTLFSLKRTERLMTSKV